MFKQVLFLPAKEAGGSLQLCVRTLCSQQWRVLVCTNGSVLWLKALFWEVSECSNTIQQQPAVPWICYTGLIGSGFVQKGTTFTSLSGCQPFLGRLDTLLSHGPNL